MRSSEKTISDRSQESQRGVSTGTLWVGALISGGLLAMQIFGFAAKRARDSSTRHVDKLRDKTLKDSFPASDPPASQYFDIPTNRQ